jgi:ATP-binding cassette subfamily B protein
VVLGQGRIVEQGRHQELLDAGNQYSRMWQSYTAGHAKEWEVAR